jgi:hypothetical protein
MTVCTDEGNSKRMSCDPGGWSGKNLAGGRVAALNLSLPFQQVADHVYERKLHGRLTGANDVVFGRLCGPQCGQSVIRRTI